MIIRVFVFSAPGNHEKQSKYIRINFNQKNPHTIRMIADLKFISDLEYDFHCISLSQPVIG